jgi:hypothetical protein
MPPVQPRYVSSSKVLLLADALWHRSSHSTAANNCVETAPLLSGQLAVRDSKAPEGPALLFGPAAWNEFLTSLLDRTRH